MDVESMTAEELANIIEQARDELLRRQNADLIGQRLADVQDELRAAGILPAPPREWARPGEVIDAYNRGDVVDWDDGQREATSGFTICEPDCDEHWINYIESEPAEVEETVEEPAEGATPWSADMGKVEAGQLISYEGHMYRPKSSHVAREEWNPAALPGVFEEVQGA